MPARKPIFFQVISVDTTLRLPADIKCREMDEVIVKGKTKPIKIFEVLV